MSGDTTQWGSGGVQLELPPGWSAGDDGDVVEIVAPGVDGAAHVSVASQPGDGPPQEGDAEKLLDEYLEDAGVGGSAEREGEREAGGCRAAAARYVKDDRDWLVVMLACGPRAALCTYNQPVGEDAARLREARALLDSVRCEQGAAA